MQCNELGTCELPNAAREKTLFSFEKKIEKDITWLTAITNPLFYGAKTFTTGKGKTSVII